MELSHEELRDLYNNLLTDNVKQGIDNFFQQDFE